MNRILVSALTFAVLTLTAACGDDDGPTGPGIVQLTSPAVVTQLAGATNSERVYQIVVPSGATRLAISTSGGTGNVDLFVRRGEIPRGSASDCESFELGTAETCEFNPPPAGTYYIVLFGSTPYSGVTLTATVTTPA